MRKKNTPQVTYIRFSSVRLYRPCALALNSRLKT